MILALSTHAGVLTDKVTNTIFAVDVVSRECEAKFVKLSQINFHLSEKANSFFNLIGFLLDQI